MRSIIRNLITVTLFFALSGLSFAQSEYADDWVDSWTVRMLDDSIVTWEITHTWVSDTGRSHIAYGIKNPGDIEFQIYFGFIFMQYYYIETTHDVTVSQLPTDLAQYTELVPSSDFQSFTAGQGKYPIKHGWKGEDEPEFDQQPVPDPDPDPVPDPEPAPCAASYLLGVDDPRLDILRQFRDENLSATDTGTKMVGMYYEKSQYIINICEKSPITKYTFRMMLEALIPVIELLK